MQKFTRPLTREIELGGARLALTLSEQGVSVRIVGTRRTPWEMSWDSVICAMTGHPPHDPHRATPEEVAAAVEAIKKGGPSKPAAAPAPAASPPPAPATAPATGATPPAAGEPAPAAERSTAPAKAGTGPALPRLEKWLSHHRRRFQEALQPGATSAELDAAQSRLGVALPADLRALLGWHNGQGADFAGHFENNWDLMSLEEIEAARKELTEGPDGWQPAWIPFLDDDSGDYVFVDASQPEAPVREFWQGKSERPVVAPSLAAWLAQFVAAVERGEYHEEPERGTFFRQTAGRES